MPTTITRPSEAQITSTISTHRSSLRSITRSAYRVMEAALSSGVTSLITQEFGPFWGVGVGSGWALRQAYAAFDAWPQFADCEPLRVDVETPRLVAGP